MTLSFITGILVAIALFWSIGAYNRLVRLRAEVVKAFSALDNVLSVQPALIQASLPAQDLAGPDATHRTDADAEPPPEAWDRLSAVGEQYARALANARARPLDPQAMAALSSAQSVLEGVWKTAGRQENENAAGAVLPDALQTRLARLADQAIVPCGLFDDAVRAYNAAIRQFPALLLALVWGFKPAATFKTQPPDGSGR